MSRHTKAAPGGRPVVLHDGYQLCARCGNTLCADDRVVVVNRAPWWAIFTHFQGPDCPPKAVSGWRAVELALDMRESNVPTPREANRVNVGGLMLPFISLLDDTHCDAEMAAVTISRGDLLPANPGSNDIDERFQPDFVESWGDHRRWREWRYKEAKIAEALDRGVVGALVKITRDLLQKERAALYAKSGGQCSVVNLSERDERHLGITASVFLASTLNGSKTRIKAYKGRVRRPTSPSRSSSSHGFSGDAVGKPGEYAVYSQRKLTDGRRVLKFGALPLDEFGFYRLSGAKPHPPALPFDSRRCPEMFDWSEAGVPKGLVEHWKGNPKSAPYGPVASLKPEFLAVLRDPPK